VSLAFTVQLRMGWDGVIGVDWIVSCNFMGIYRLKLCIYVVAKESVGSRLGSG
jgi:hypothetical protein